MDALGRELIPGELVIYTDPKSSGFSVTVVKNIKVNTVNLVNPGYGPSRKDKDNVIIITEEQLFTMMRKIVRPDIDGIVRERKYIRNVNGEYIYENLEFTPEQKLDNLVRPYIQLSRMIKNVDLEEYEPTPEEREKLKIWAV